MNVETYRKTIRRRMWIMAALGTLYIVATIAMHVFGNVTMNYAEDFLLGAVSAVVVCCAAIMPRYRKALRDEQALRRLWNREHDERMRAIKAKAGVPMLLYTSIAMIAAALLIAPQNMTIAFTLLAAATLQLLASTVVKCICMRTM